MESLWSGLRRLEYVLSTCPYKFTANCLPCMSQFRRIQADGRPSARASGNCCYIILHNERTDLHPTLNNPGSHHFGSTGSCTCTLNIDGDKLAKLGQLHPDCEDVLGLGDVRTTCAMLISIVLVSTEFNALRLCDFSGPSRQCGA